MFNANFFSISSRAATSDSSIFCLGQSYNFYLSIYKQLLDEILI